jgi:hypothetical protein
MNDMKAKMMKSLERVRSLKNLNSLDSLISLIFLIFLSACTENDNLPAGNAGSPLAVQITGQGFTSGAPETRATDSGYNTTFAAGDCIGIFAVANGSVQGDNVPYTYNGSAWVPAVDGNPVYRYTGGTYFAYYPYDPAMTGKTTEAEVLAAFIPKTDQGTQSDYTASDLMTGSGMVSGATLAITLTHQLAMLEVSLPSVATDVKFRINNVEVIPWLTGNVRRVLVKPTSVSVMVDGSYRIDGKPMVFSKSTGFLASHYTRLNIIAPSAISGGYTGAMAVNYVGDTSEEVTIPDDGIFQLANGTGKTIRSIVVNGHTHLIGRTTNKTLLLNVDADGDLHFRPADSDGNIPIGSYAEFQMINTATIGKYKQEADLDLMSVEWTPIGYPDNNWFKGAFDGSGYTLANLKITVTASSARVGLFKSIIGSARLSNIAIVSGSVKGGNYVGAVCGQNNSGGQLTACYNKASVEGLDLVGGVCGWNNGGKLTACYNTAPIVGHGSSLAGGTGGVSGKNTGTITACYNSGSVSGNTEIGGVCGTNSDIITACYTVSNATNGATEFGSTSWPATTTHTEWGIGDGSGSGKYWKSLGYWDAVAPVYPKLWFEE